MRWRRRGALSGAAAMAAVASVLGLLLAAAPPAAAHYLPRAGDDLHYTETIELDGGTGNYTGYTENTFINGSLSVRSVLPNGTENASYQSTTHWENNNGQAETYPSQGNFTFSALSFHYVQGTDNQTGYTDPYVWFFMNASLGVGATFYLLNSPFTVLSTNQSYPWSASPTGYVATLAATSTGSYQRNDVYGVFTASYTWQAYFDPATGYIVGYLYTEHDRDTAGDGFTWIDALSVTSASYPLTPATAPPPAASPSSSSALLPYVALGILAAAAVVAVVVVVVVRARRGRAHPLPAHAPGGSVPYAPAYAAPAPVNLTPSGQPAVQQVVLRETVKVNCRYCGTLIDTTATVCPVCGAPRS